MIRYEIHYTGWFLGVNWWAEWAHPATVPTADGETREVSQ